MLIGYDIDGVISLGICPQPKNSVIITGRSYEEAKETFELLQSQNIICPVYMSPWPISAKTREKSGQWKAEMIRRLNVGRFFEDDPIQFNIIKNMCQDLIDDEEESFWDLVRIQHNHNEIL